MLHTIAADGALYTLVAMHVPNRFNVKDSDDVAHANAYSDYSERVRSRYASRLVVRR